MGPANVAETANQMGVQTDSPPRTSVLVNDGPFEPYNPALILGGLRTGVTPLEMAHAYQTLQHDGQIVSGTMAASPTGPIAIQKVRTTIRTAGNLVETNDGDPGQDKVETKQEVAPEVATTARGILHTVVTSGTGRTAYTGDPSEWGKTGTTENNGDAWFVGATKDVTVAVWVGHANSVKPMETEYGGAPVDGGTIPALIFNQVVNAVEQLNPTRPPTPRLRAPRPRPRPLRPRARARAATRRRAGPAPRPQAQAAPQHGSRRRPAVERRRGGTSGGGSSGLGRLAPLSAAAATGTRCPPRRSAREARRRA